MDDSFKHPKFPHITIKRCNSKDDLLMCLKAYAERSVVDNEFIKQMNISPKDFYEQALLPIAD